jgi:hypothetical protein
MAIPVRVPVFPQIVKEAKAGTERRPDLKYPNPKILLMDLKDDSEETLASQGYNVETGSFGTPYKVKKSDDFQPITQCEIRRP